MEKDEDDIPFKFPFFLNRFTMIPILRGHSLYEVMEYWSINDLYLYHINRQFESVYESRRMKAQDRRNKARQEREEVRNS